MSEWKLTIRHGSEVSREHFDDLDAAIARAEEVADEIVAEGPLGDVKAIRDYSPRQRINARLEISGKGLLRPPTAGMDIHGDLSLVGYSGSVRRKPLGGGTSGQIFHRIREALAR